MAGATALAWASTLASRPPPGAPARGPATGRSAASAPAKAVAAATQPAAGLPASRPKPSPPDGRIRFESDVVPVLERAGCAAAHCHGAQAGKGGLKLSLFAADPQADYDAITRDAEGRRIDRAAPARSLLVLKAGGAVPHEGKAPLRPGSAEHSLVVSWIAQGTARLEADAPRPVGLVLVPDAVSLDRGAAVRFGVTAAFSDGSRRDVASAAVLRSSDDKVAAVEPTGEVRARGVGECFIVASYLRQFATARLAVPQKPPPPFPEFPPANRIDELVVAKLRQLGIPPAEPCTDEAFLRRVHLDATGALPTPEQARAFLADRSADKRARLIDRLLASDEFADFWTMKWADLLRIKSEYPVKVWPKAVQTYYRWVRDCIARNKPYDQFVRELLTSSGSNFRDGPANYYRAVTSKDPQTFGETTAMLFMGVRLGCARCHGHPYENWSLDENLGVAAFFANVRFKPTMEWKEEIVYVDASGVLRHPRTGQPVKCRVLGWEAPPAGSEQDTRAVFADWLTSPENPWFARNIVNRIWCWLLGRGIVHEPDDVRPTNPPSNPALLDWLAGELVARKYDTRHIFRLILNSRTYQSSSRTNQWNAGDMMHFSHYVPKRLGAEQLLDAISRVTGTSETFRSMIPEPYTRLPSDFGSVQVADGSISTAFLELFGRPPRDTPYESDRCGRTSMRQALHLLNSSELEGKIAGGTRLKQLLQPGRGDAEIVEELYLAALSRLPTDREKSKALEHLSRDSKARAQALHDLIWALLNTKEFLFIH